MNLAQLIKKIIYFVIVLVIASCQQQAVNSLLKGPYLQKLAKQEITIVWEADTTYPGKVYYGIGDKLDRIAETNKQKKVQKITLTDLQPETKYSYQVEVNDYKSEIYSFTTMIKDKSPFTFAAYGDNKNGPFNHKRIADLILSYNPIFVSNNGDLVEKGYVYNQWEKLFFTPAHNLMANIPLVPAIGNHEKNAEYYYNYFCMPDNKAWSSFDINDAHFIIVNTESEFMSKGSEQYNWLIKDLESNNSTWKFVFQHVPLFTSGGNYYSTGRVEMKNLLHPIYEKYKVDMVFSGHDHHYERTKPIGSKNSNHTVTYIVGGNGGTPKRYIGVRRNFSFASQRTFGFSLIDIDGSKLRFREISIDNKVLDEFELDKSKPESISNYLTNKINSEEIEDPKRKVMKLYRTLGRKLYKKKKYTEAIAPLKQAFELDENCAEASGTLALCYARIGDFENAKKYADTTICIAPLFPYSYTAMAEIFKKQKNYKQAIKWYEKQFSIQRDSPNALEDIAGIYKELGKFDLAISTYKKAIDVLPNNWELHFNLAKLYEKLSNKNEALSEYKLAVNWFYNESRNDDYSFATEKIRELSK